MGIDHSRRKLLLQGLFGAGLIGLRSLASGIPAAILLDPSRAMARRRQDALPPRNPQYVIASTSAEGDPITCNLPGTYDDPGILHPAAPEMAPTAIQIAGRMQTAAAPWATLPQTLLDRTCFFHHGTYTVVHSEHERVQELNGYSIENEMLLSLLAAQLAPALGTVQQEPIALGPRKASEAVLFQRRPQAILRPTALALLLGSPTGPLASLTALRDHDLDRLNAIIKREGSSAQATFVDQYAQSQAQIRSLSDDLISTLQSIQDDSVASQIQAAVTLIRMNVTPVVNLHIPFGGDNHNDRGLAVETRDTVSGLVSLNTLWTTLKSFNLQDRVSFLSFNVFGRTMGQGSANGRAHNGNHHTAVMFGSGFRGSVIGGIERVATDYGATSIDSVTGAGVPGGSGDIPFGETLQSMAKTFGCGTGVDPAVLDAQIRGGKAIQAALVVS